MELDEESKQLWEEFKFFERINRAKKYSWVDYIEKELKSQPMHIDCHILLDSDVRSKIETKKPRHLPTWYKLNYCCECGKSIIPMSKKERKELQELGMEKSCCKITESLEFDWIKVKENKTGNSYPFSISYCFHCGGFLTKRNDQEQI